MSEKNFLYFLNEGIQEVSDKEIEDFSKRFPEIKEGETVVKEEATDETKRFFVFVDKEGKRTIENLEKKGEKIDSLSPFDLDMAEMKKSLREAFEAKKYLELLDELKWKSARFSLDGKHIGDIAIRRGWKIVSPKNEVLEGTSVHILSIGLGLGENIDVDDIFERFFG